ncbi:hypothetical protein F4823DRAFT_582601 [Ustulina deusta]|nr:hypothetical protein F4823DRAFT_582601 [Ustulina deusta]
MPIALTMGILGLYSHLCLCKPLQPLTLNSPHSNMPRSVSSNAIDVSMKHLAQPIRKGLKGVSSTNPSDEITLEIFMSMKAPGA